MFLVYYICTCIYLATCPDLKNVEFFGAGEARLEFPPYGCERHTEGSLQDITRTSEGERVIVVCMIICNLYHLVTLSALSLKAPPQASTPEWVLTESWKMCAGGLRSNMDTREYWPPSAARNSSRHRQWRH